MKYPAPALAAACATLILLNGCTATMVTTTKHDANGNPYTEQHVEQRFDGEKFGRAILIGLAAGAVGAAAGYAASRPYYGPYGHRYYVPPVYPVVIPVAVPGNQRIVVEHRYEKAPAEREADRKQREADDAYNRSVWEKQASYSK